MKQDLQYLRAWRKPATSLEWNSIDTSFNSHKDGTLKWNQYKGIISLALFLEVLSTAWLAIWMNQLLYKSLSSWQVTYLFCGDLHVLYWLGVTIGHYFNLLNQTSGLPSRVSHHFSNLAIISGQEDDIMRASLGYDMVNNDFTPPKKGRPWLNSFACE